MSDDISIPRPGPMPVRTSFTHSYRARRAGMDEGTRRLLILAGALGLVLVAGMGVWSVVGRHSSGIPVIEADPRPVRVKPDNPGGMQVVGANEQIMNGADGTGADKMGPVAETPDPQALRAQVVPRTAPAPATPVAPTPAVPAPVAPQGAAPAVLQPATEPAATAHPAPHPAPAVHVAAGSSGTMVQLGALDSEAAAKAEWQRLAKRLPDVLGGRDPVVQRAERDGKVIWRIRLGGFSDIADAAAFCGRVRAKGGACALASF